MKQLLLLFALGLASCTQAPHADNTPKDPKALPSIVLLKGDTVSKFSSDSLTKGRATLLYFYGPGCLQCDTFSQKLVDSMDAVKDVNLLFISAGSFHEVKNYQQKYNVERFPNVRLGLDYNNTFVTFYGGLGYPFLVFYDKDQQIKRANYGPMSMDTIRAIIDK
jgi:thiol-disulfide isomerase/thioredoxin